MKRIYKELVLMLMLSLVIPAAADAQAIAYYSGVVKNTDNMPVENVSVSSSGAETVNTNTDGGFLLSFTELNPDSGDFAAANVYFSHPDYVVSSKNIFITPGDSLTGDTIVLHKPASDYSISGKVTYENGDPVRIGEVAFFSVDGEHSYYATPDGDGNYQLMVPEGSYYLRSRASYRQYPVWAYRYIYYNGAGSIADADIYTVSGNVTDLNIVHKALSIGSISGKVTDAATQLPLEMATISVSSMPLLDSNIIATDANGDYTINVFEGDYTLFAYKNDYKLTFYNQVYNIFEATPVSVSADNLHITGIDFALITPELGTNTISGNVTDESTGLPLADVEVFAIPLDGGNWDLSSTGGTAADNPVNKLRKTDNNGVYTLKNMVNGAYVLLFYKKNYIGTYNGGVYAWESAPVINLSGNSNVNVNAALKMMSSFGGEISGTVTSSGTAVSGSLLSAFDPDGNIISAEVSGLDGNYIVPSLSEGEFTVKASKVGKNTAEYPEKIQINYVSSLTKDGVNLLLTSTDVKEKPVQPKEYKLMQNYSNPFNPSTTIAFELPNAGYAELKVYDVLGNEVAALVNGVTEAGRHEVVFNAKDLSSGIYFYRLKAGNYLKTMKMILMK